MCTRVELTVDELLVDGFRSRDDALQFAVGIVATFDDLGDGHPFAFAFVVEKLRHVFVYQRIDLCVVFRSVGHAHHIDEFSAALDKKQRAGDVDIRSRHRCRSSYFEVDEPVEFRTLTTGVDLCLHARCDLRRCIAHGEREPSAPSADRTRIERCDERD